jgi:2-haloacid dehalogenase
LDQPTLARERFRKLLRTMGAPHRLSRALGEGYLAELSQRGDLLPACRGTLRSLSGRYLLGLVTNGIDRVQRSRLRASGLDRLFQAVVTSEGCGFTKPDPRIVRVALDALGVLPHQALFVGDDVAADGGAARGAAVPFLWLDHGGALPKGVTRPRRRIRSLVELRVRLAASGVRG